MRSWRVLRRETLFSHRLFDLRRESLVAGPRVDSAATPPSTGAADETTREALTLDAPTWVNVIALLPDEGVLLVRQWRYGIGAETLEIPGGMVEVAETDDPRAAAGRELLEETGYRAGRLTYLGEVEPNPAFITNRCLTFVAEDLVREGEPEGDGEEELVVEIAALDEIPRLILSGAIRHALVIAAFYLFEHSRRSSALDTELRRSSAPDTELRRSSVLDKELRRSSL
ncbi:MAG: NUDIX hydrolase [Thermoanaerobaculia bacterium]